MSADRRAADRSHTHAGTVREPTVARELVLTDEVDLPPFADMVPGAVQEVRDDPVTFRQLQHDTADLRLARWGAELRVRLDGPDAGWRLTLPLGDGAGQDETTRDVVVHELVDDDSGEHAPADLLDLVTALVREAEVRPVAQLRTTRASVHLLDPAAVELAAVHDDRIEAELRARGTERQRRLRITAFGPPPDAERAVTRLVDAVQAVAGDVEPGDARSSGTPPAARLPDVVVPSRPGSRSTAREVLTFAVALHVGAFIAADVGVRRDRPDAVHQLRVAARTLRSALRTFTPVCDEAWATGLRDRLAVAADALGAVRDTEVLYDRLERDVRTLAAEDRVRALPALDALLRPRLLEARSAALEELRSDRYLQLLVDLVEAARRPLVVDAADTEAAEVLPALVMHDWKRLRRAVRTLRQEHPDPHAPAWHRARILAKRARYGAQATAPSLGGRARRCAEELSGVTDLLGELHDGVVAAQVLQEAADAADGATGFALGRLLAVEDAAVRRAAAEFLERWPRVRRRLGRRPVG
ncbi:CHAD domain-containing protein [Cellulomonas sp. SG140]|uniref:CYTH and CHAD domain-containing protein n=1 Tax=Cellulomonas sp. SG140 TaxID=2976536 RepID=UPI0021E7B995|nr:CHAD domain-containing protein [Cellulomonas sp. SG140]